MQPLKKLWAPLQRLLPGDLDFFLGLGFIDFVFFFGGGSGFRAFEGDGGGGRRSVICCCFS